MKDRRGGAGGEGASGDRQREKSENDDQFFHAANHRFDFRRRRADAERCLYFAGAATSRTAAPARRYSVSRRRISSPVAGAASCGMAPRAMNDSAFFTAIHTEMASSSGGSPTALLDPMFSVLPSFSIQSTLKTGGRSWMLGILYVVGECDSSSPSGA